MTQGTPPTPLSKIPVHVFLFDSIKVSTLNFGASYAPGQIPYPYPLSLPPLYISPPPSLPSYPKAWTEVSLYFSGGMRVIILKADSVV